jgi:glutamyl-tRNA synthetase
MGDARGQRLSKRDGSAGVAALRQQGLDAPAVVGALAASAGLVPAGSRLSASELLEELQPAGFDLALQTRSPGALQA